MFTATGITKTFTHVLGLDIESNMILVKDQNSAEVYTGNNLENKDLLLAVDDFNITSVTVDENGITVEYNANHADIGPMCEVKEIMYPFVVSNIGGPYNLRFYKLHS